MSDGFESYYGKAAAMTKEALLKEVVILCEKNATLRAQIEDLKKLEQESSLMVCKLTAKIENLKCCGNCSLNESNKRCIKQYYSQCDLVSCPERYPHWKPKGGRNG